MAREKEKQRKRQGARKITRALKSATRVWALLMEKKTRSLSVSFSEGAIKGKQKDSRDRAQRACNERASRLDCS